MKALEINNRLAIVEPAQLKKSVMVRLKLKGDRLSGVLQNNQAGSQPEIIDLSAEEVLAIFPNDQPKPGSVYKCKIAPYTSSFRAKKWGQIHLYRGLADAEIKILTKALNRVYSDFIKSHKLTFVLPITLEIRSNEGKIQGYYQPEKKDREHSICLCPTSFVTDGVDGISRLLAHEIGHPLKAVYLPQNVFARWIKLYASYNVIKDLTAEDLKSNYADFFSSGELPSAYRKNLEDTEKIIFNAILKYIKATYHLSLKDLDLVVAKKSSGIEKYWPTSKLKLSEITVPVSSYASKNAEEFWCEALSAYFAKDKLPKEILKLLKISIRAMQPK